MLDHVISHVWLLHFFTLPPNAKKKTSEYSNFLLLPTAGIKPGSPAQQASVLSITPLPLDRCIGTYRHWYLSCLKNHHHCIECLRRKTSPTYLGIFITTHLRGSTSVGKKSLSAFFVVNTQKNEKGASRKAVTKISIIGIQSSQETSLRSTLFIKKL